MITRLKNLLFGTLPNDVTKFYNGLGAFSTPSGSGDWDGTITKGADQDVTNSTTYVDDLSLLFATIAGAIYNIEMVIVFSASSTANDLKWRFAVAAGTFEAAFHHVGIGISGSAQHVTVIATGGVSVIADQTNGDPSSLTSYRAVLINGWFMATDTTTFKLQWAQNTGGAATITRVKTGSILRQKQLAA